MMLVGKIFFLSSNVLLPTHIVLIHTAEMSACDPHAAKMKTVIPICSDLAIMTIPVASVQALNRSYLS